MKRQKFQQQNDDHLLELPPFISHSSPAFRFNVQCMGGGGGGKIDEPNDAKALVDIANATMQRYETVVAPIENEFIAESLNYDNEDRGEQLAGQAQAGTSVAYSEAAGDDVDAMTSSGINPNSGTFTSALDDRYMDSAASATGSVSRSRQALQDAGITAKQNIVAMGQGKETQAIDGLNSMAVDSTQRARDEAFSDHNDNAAKNYAVGSAIGGATRYAIEESGKS